MKEVGLGFRILALFRMGLFGASYRWGGGGEGFDFLKSVTYPAVMKLSKVIPYLKEIQKIFKPRETPLEFCKSAKFAISRNIACVLIHSL